MVVGLVAGRSLTRELGSSALRAAPVRMAQKRREGQHQDEYLDQLKQLVPGMNQKRHATKTEVMEEAARYIEKLQNNLIGQIRTHGYPEKLKSYSKNMPDDRESIRKAVEHYVHKNMP